MPPRPFSQTIRRFASSSRSTFDGHALDLDRLGRLRDKYQITVIEDCAQAIGASWKGISCGSVGAAGAVSFYPTKNLGALGDGGAVVTSDPELAGRASALRDDGQSDKYVHTELGLNSRLDEVQAAILSEALLPGLSRTPSAAERSPNVIDPLWPTLGLRYRRLLAGLRRYGTCSPSSLNTTATHEGHTCLLWALTRSSTTQRPSPTNPSWPGSVIRTRSRSRMPGESLAPNCRFLFTPTSPMTM